MTMRVHPELQKRLEQHDDAPVQVVVQLRPVDQPQTAPSPKEFASLAESVMDRVSSEVGHPAQRANFLANLATVIVEADPEFVRTLVDQPEVISAMPNITAESPLIAPIEKKVVARGRRKRAKE